jgi:pimeloyl-ACP methyl ester carboxylesterase
MSNADTHPFIDGLAHFFATSMRTPVLHHPDEYGMEYEDVFFPSMDGTVLEGWFIPGDSDKLVIANHPMPCNRYGYPGHLEPFTNFGGFEVNFLPDYKHLHDAGYSVLAYDLRNHGRSAAGSGGLVGIGLLEYRDVIGSIQYVRSRKETAGMQLGLLSRCLGANSTIVAMSRHPEYFEDVRAMVAVQPVSARPFIERASEQAGIEDGAAIFDTRIRQLTGFALDELSPIQYARDVKVPTLVAQVHDDASTRPEDVQTIYDNLGSAEKDLLWIEGTTRRFDGYNYFGEHPDRMLSWFDSHFRR